MSPMPPVTRALLIVCTVVYALQISGWGDWLLLHFALWPPSDARFVPGIGQPPPFQLWQLLSYGFLHGSPMHIVFNCLALWMFGSELERFWGSGPFLRFVLVCIAGAGLAQLGVAMLSAQPYPTVGISGGVYGVLLGFGWMFPNRIIMPLFPPIPMKARTAVFLFAALELYLGVVARGGGIAHFAHLGGLFTGWLMIEYWRGRLPFKPKRILRY